MFLARHINACCVTVADNRTCHSYLILLSVPLGGFDWDALYEEEDDDDQVSMEGHGFIIQHLLSQVRSSPLHCSMDSYRNHTYLALRL